MTPRLPALVLQSAAICLISACFPFSAGERHLDGPYTLYATDIAEQMELDYAIGHGAFVERVPPTVFAAGWNARYVIVKRHPNGDRARTEFYILDRSKDGPLVDPGVSVTGPLTAAEFDARRRELSVDSTLSFRVVLPELE